MSQGAENKQSVSLQAYAAAGFLIVPKVLSEAAVQYLRSAISFDQIGSTHRRGSSAYANRQALEQKLVSALASSPAVKHLAAQALGAPAFAVRAILFDKVPGANWKVPWHQDLTVAVKERAELPEYGPWSIKEDIIHVQPPTRVLRQMVAVRLHLDECGSGNGPLKVLSGSHAHGRLAESRVSHLVEELEPVELTCLAGDAILMSPLLIHASSPAFSPGHRRVIHIDYASCELDAPLEWANIVS